MKKFSVIAIAALMSVAMMSTLPALADPPGNNGTVKLDGRPFEKPADPDNEPHIACRLQLDFFGFDQGDYFATATFELQAPTLGTSNLLLTKSNIFVGEDPAGGGTDVDAQVPINLSGALASSGATPHPIQGYHVKVTVNAPFSIGADTKYKVFWVQPCAS
jgi:hypothetical protein